MLRYCGALTNEERYAAIDLLVKQTDKTLEPYIKGKDNWGARQRTFFYALLCCCRCKEDLKRVKKQSYNTSFINPLECLDNWDEYTVVEDYIRQFGQEIVVICLKELEARQWNGTSFLFIWHLYEVGALAYNEELFLNAFVTEGRFYLHPELLKPLIANEEFAEKILGNLYKYGSEINIFAKHLKE